MNSLAVLSQMRLLKCKDEPIKTRNRMYNFQTSREKKKKNINLIDMWQQMDFLWIDITGNEPKQQQQKNETNKQDTEEILVS